jgi:anti-anti-sigma factor
MSDPHLPFRSPSPERAVAAAEPSGVSWTRLAESGGSIRLVLAGELDLATRGHFETALADAQDDSDRVLLDLGALTLIDCANLFVVFAAGERSRREEATVILLKPRGQVRRVLDLVGTPAGVANQDHEDLPGHGLRAAA